MWRNSSGFSQGSCEAGSEVLLENGYDNNGSSVFQGGLLEEFEASNFSYFSPPPSAIYYLFFCRVLVKLKNETLLIELKNGTIVHDTITANSIVKHPQPPTIATDTRKHINLSSFKLVPVKVDGAVIIADGGGKRATVVAVPKVAVKLDPKGVIEISLDTLEGIKIKKPVVNNKKTQLWVVEKEVPSNPHY
ncbi:hypothetical protein RHMOL_Rhmol06G0156600 [Rhododendron molle]|uniref:Uncharacterized protein n=1 Tax=Rhododendron molle TaxID=49168 RepID=A0ACC0NCW9_RHOML|nr:hypothetical protein RHMOL_Rhmol06G0156600 [Rhododendron molle]